MQAEEGKLIYLYYIYRTKVISTCLSRIVQNPKTSTIQVLRKLRKKCAGIYSCAVHSFELLGVLQSSGARFFQRQEVKEIERDWKRASAASWSSPCNFRGLIPFRSSTRTASRTPASCWLTHELHVWLAVPLVNHVYHFKVGSLGYKTFKFSRQFQDIPGPIQTASSAGFKGMI